MSLQRVFLNASLRTVEKPFLTKVETPLQLRRRFEASARLLFHAPWNTRFDWNDIGGRSALWVYGRHPGPEVILYFHGGAYVFGSPNTHSALLACLAGAVGARACLPRYRLAPEHPCPAALDDAVSVYLGLLDQGHSPGQIVLGGDSAGGGLALCLLARLIREGHALPAGAFAFSPLTDLTFSGDSFRDNAEAEALLPASRAHELSEMYLAGAAPDTPDASPLFADFTGAPPIWLCVGSTEILRDDTLRLATRLEADNVDVSLSVETDLPHVWPIFHNVLPEARATLRDLSGWIRQQWARTADS